MKKYEYMHVDSDILVTGFDAIINEFNSLVYVIAENYDLDETASVEVNGHTTTVGVWYKDDENLTLHCALLANGFTVSFKLEYVCYEDGWTLDDVDLYSVDTVCAL